MNNYELINKLQQRLALKPDDLQSAQDLFEMARIIDAEKDHETAMKLCRRIVHDAGAQSRVIRVDYELSERYKAYKTYTVNLTAAVKTVSSIVTLGSYYGPSPTYDVVGRPSGRSIKMRVITTIKFEHNPLDHIRETSPFGWRTHPVSGVRKLHNGVDLGARVAGKQGDPIYAVAPGTVMISKCDSGNPKIGYGYYTVIDHGGWSGLYAHQIANDIRVGAKAKVKTGQKIGRMGSSGASTGAHMHLGVTSGSYYSKQWVDPAVYLVEEGVRQVSKAEAIKIIKEACDFEDGTMQFLDSYRYGDAMILKLATAIRGGK